MKQRFYLLSFFLLTAVLLFNISCEESADDQCVSDTICEEPVTACCSDPDDASSCVWKYEGETYTDIYDLYEALGCDESAVVLKSADNEPSEEILAQLVELRARAMAKCRVFN